MTLLELLPPEAREKLGPNLTLELATSEPRAAWRPVVVRVRVPEAFAHLSNLRTFRLERAEGRVGVGQVWEQEILGLAVHPLVEVIELAEAAPPETPPREEPELPIVTLLAGLAELLEKPIVRFGIVFFVVRSLLKRAGVPL